MRVEVTKAESQSLRQTLSQAKEYDHLKDLMGPGSGAEDLQEIIKSIEDNPPRQHRMVFEKESIVFPSVSQEDTAFSTPKDTQNPEPPSSGAPFLPNDRDMGKMAATLLRRENTTPTPNGNGRLNHASI
jgi:tRNA-dihydrouridine synthase 2